MGFETHRPEGFKDNNRRLLQKISQSMATVIVKAQRLFIYPTLRLHSGKERVVADALVELAEDIVNDIGIWTAYERYNKEFFGTPLPLTGIEDGIEPEERISEQRVRHFLWRLYPMLIPDLILSPTHIDLQVISGQIARFLSEAMESVPPGSTVKSFLAQPNDDGVVVKRKLLWLGRHSYLFRQCFHNYIQENGGEESINVTDDFVCQNTTAWSGLGVIDILASLLDIPEDRRKELRSWYERHMAFFRILKTGGEHVEVLNVVNGKPYTVRTGRFTHEFNSVAGIFGSLVPWGGEWYWSGAQSWSPETTDEKEREIRKDFLRDTGTMVYRYCHDLAEKARVSVRLYHEQFAAYHGGDDLAVYPDGLSMAADEEKRHRLMLESLPKETIAAHCSRHGLETAKPQMKLPSNVLNCENGVAIFYNPEEGLEIVIGFNDIKGGMAKKGVGLDDDEIAGIQQFILSESLSPAFVRRMVKDFGHESIAAVFLIKDTKDDGYLDCLLRSHKGHFYRKRYPAISIISE